MACRDSKRDYKDDSSCIVLHKKAAETVRISGEIPNLEICVEYLMYCSLERSCSWIDVICYPDGSGFHFRICDNGKSLNRASLVKGGTGARSEIAVNKEHFALDGSSYEGILFKVSHLSRWVHLTCLDSNGTCRQSTGLVNGRECNLSMQLPFRFISKPNSTNVTVLDLFHSVPVRRRELMDNLQKHLAAMKSILDFVSLCYPSVCFSLDVMQGASIVRERRVLRETSSSLSRLKDTGLCCDSNSNLIRIRSLSAKNFSISGYLNLSCPKRSSCRLLFVNDRLLREHSSVYRQFQVVFLGALMSQPCSCIDTARAGLDNLLCVFFINEKYPSGSIGEAMCSLESSLVDIVRAMVSHIHPTLSAWSNGEAKTDTNLNPKDILRGQGEGQFYHFIDRVKLPLTSQLASFGCSSEAACRLMQCKLTATTTLTGDRKPFLKIAQQQSNSDVVKETVTGGVCGNESQDHTPQATQWQSTSEQGSWNYVVDRTSGNVSLIDTKSRLAKASLPSPDVRLVSPCFMHHLPVAGQVSMKEADIEQVLASEVPAFDDERKCFAPPLLVRKINLTLPTSVEKKSLADVGKVFQLWKNPIWGAVAKNIDSSCQVLSSKPLDVAKFSKASISGLQVIGQVDKKFIACMSEGSCMQDIVTVLVDQHAASERVRLEELENGLFTSRESTGCWLDKCKSMAADRCLYVKSADTPLAISFTIDHAGRGNHNIKLLKTYLLHHGIKAIQCVNSGSCYCLTVSAIPSVLQYKWSENKENLVSAVKDIVGEVCELFHLGVFSPTTTTLRSTLASLACHSAVRFGDHLSNSECTELVESLSRCRLPFQCAHGRPSIVPLARLSSIRSQELAPDAMRKQLKLHRLEQLYQIIS